MIKSVKRCSKCGETKDTNKFAINNAMKDKLSIHCKRCMAEATRKSRGLDDELTTKEQSILLKYLPYAHEGTQILSKKPDGLGKEDSIPLTLADISRDNDITYTQAQQMLYKFTRLNLVTMIIQNNNDGGVDTLVYYKKDNVINHVFHKKDEANAKA